MPDITLHPPPKVLPGDLLVSGIPATVASYWAAVMLMQHPGKVLHTPDDHFPGHALVPREEQDFVWKQNGYLFMHAFLLFAS